MRRCILSITILVVLLAGCRRDNDQNFQTGIEGRWKMVAVLDKSTSQTQFAPAGAEQAVYIQFSGNGFSGRTIVNTFWGGTFQLTNSTDIVFGTYSQTKVGEDPWGAIMLTMLNACMLQSVFPCKPSTISWPAANQMKIDLPLRYTVFLQKF